MNTADAIVVGSGVIGTSIAYRLAQRGLKVLQIDRAGIAAGTSGACDQAVMLQSKKPGRHLEMALASAAIYAGLEEELGMPIEYARHGGMIVIETEEQLQVMTGFVAQQRQAGLAVELLPRDEARRRQPGLAPHVVAATWSDQDAKANPMLLAFAFARAGRRLGVRHLFGITVTGLITAGGRVVGVRTDRGDYHAAWVILAAGPHTPAIARQAGCDLPIRPRRGQLIVTEPLPPVVRGNINCARYIASKLNPALLEADDPAARMGIGLSLGQTDAGNLLIGGSREFVGFDRSTVPGVIQAILQHAMRMFPALGGVRAIRTLAGLRPYTPDSLPIIGHDPERPGLVIAAGHEGDGIALAPVTGVMVADLLTGGPAAQLAQGLGPERFRKVTAGS